MSPRSLLVASSLGALALGALACGGGKTGGSGSSSASSPGPVAPTPPSVALDCSSLVERIHTCADSFAAAWAKTEDGARSGDPERFMTAFRHAHNRDGLGMPLCTDSWQTRDLRWKVRLKACEAETACEAFSACAAPALGDPLPPPPPPE